MTPTAARNLAISRTVARPISDPGCGRWTTIRSSPLLKPTRDPSRSVTSTPQCSSALITSFHRRFAGDGVLLIRFNVLRCLVLIAYRPPLPPSARPLVDASARVAGNAADHVCGAMRPQREAAEDRWHRTTGVRDAPSIRHRVRSEGGVYMKTSVYPTPEAGNAKRSCSPSASAKGHKC